MAYISRSSFRIHSWCLPYLHLAFTYLFIFTFWVEIFSSSYRCLLSGIGTYDKNYKHSNKLFATQRFKASPIFSPFVHYGDESINGFSIWQNKEPNPSQLRQTEYFVLHFIEVVSLIFNTIIFHNHQNFVLYLHIVMALINNDK